jgi:DNA-directed RNA polymerase specialized sigma24 family protein
MTTQRSQIFRAFTRGESITRIAENCGVSYGKAWSHLRRAVAELDRKNRSHSTRFDGSSTWR